MTKASGEIQLDQIAADFIRAIAREAARQDHDAKFNGKTKPTAASAAPSTKSRTKVVVRISDGKGGYTLHRSEDGRRYREQFQEQMQRVLADWKAGRHDEIGLSKRLKMPFPK